MAQEHRSHATADSAQRQATALRDEEVKELARLKEEIASLRAQVQATRATATGAQPSANGRARRASNAEQNIDATNNDIKRLKTEHALLRARLRAMRSALGKASTDDGSTVEQGREEPMSEPPPTSLNAEVQQMKSELLTLRTEAVSWRPFASDILLKYLDDVEFKKNKKRVNRTSEVESQAAHTDNYCADSGTSVASTRHKACPTSEQLAPRPQRAERVDCNRLTKEIAWLEAEIGLARSVQSSRLGSRQGHDERVDQPFSGHLQDTAQEAQSSAIQPHNVACDKNSEIATRPADKVRYVKRKRSGVPLEKDAEEKKRKRSESFFLRALHHTSMQSGASGSFGRAFASPITAASASGRAGH
ncbi:hypothetical protein WOLCODRAFT_155757 [Wolfiporia cocos MD-104 SS10]|uniref:Uncharacterized protein n=1 Tax=Wolfiporia cocos (strain MD-104) TaxID=742152 RepID=A0A2H3JGE9_WOLCO|nr:hypothetical protein WOLCODRAFT_155757 [Wolfiporia cocos MD-104 SS10]